MNEIIISNVNDAWTHQRKINPGYRRIDYYRSKAKHDGPIGITHIISLSSDSSTIEYLTRKSYWFDKCQRFLSHASLPREDREPALGDTIKTDMLNKMMQWHEKGYLVRHVTVMPDGQVFTFRAQAIYRYVKDYHTYLDHFHTGPDGAVFYPQRLAIEIIENKKGELDKYV